MKQKLFYSVVALLALMQFGCSSTEKKSTDPRAVAEIYDPSVSSPSTAELNDSSGYVFDGGKYVEGREDVKIRFTGGKNGVYLPEEKFVSLDRQQVAPIGKILYVMTNESPAHCVRARFATYEGKKVLEVYPKSNVPSDFCVYQSAFREEGTGFSIFLNDGPVCRPSTFSLKEDGQKRKIASVDEVEHTVSLSYCVNNTVSFGLSRSKHK